MTLDQFHNGLRILRSIDRHELVFAGDDIAAWERFCASPFDWMIRAPDLQAERLWDLMVARGAEHGGVCAVSPAIKPGG